MSNELFKELERLKTSLKTATGYKEWLEKKIINIERKIGEAVCSFCLGVGHVYTEGNDEERMERECPKCKGRTSCAKGQDGPAQDTKEAVDNELTTRKACHYDCDDCHYALMETARCSMCIRKDGIHLLWSQS